MSLKFYGKTKVCSCLALGSAYGERITLKELIRLFKKQKVRRNHPSEFRRCLRPKAGELTVAEEGLIHRILHQMLRIMNTQICHNECVADRSEAQPYQADVAAETTQN